MVKGTVRKLLSLLSYTEICRALKPWRLVPRKNVFRCKAGLILSSGFIKPQCYGLSILTEECFVRSRYQGRDQSLPQTPPSLLNSTPLHTTPLTLKNTCPGTHVSRYIQGELTWDKSLLISTWSCYMCLVCVYI